MNIRFMTSILSTCALALMEKGSHGGTTAFAPGLVKSSTSIHRLHRHRQFSASTQASCQRNHEETPRSSKIKSLSTNHTDIISKLVLSTSMALLILLSSTSSAVAFDPSVFNGNYDDPFHPLCERKIEVSADGKSFHYSGTAVGPKDDPVRRGCTLIEQKEFGLRKGELDGIIIDNRISAGDGIHEGVWEPKGTAADNSLSGVNFDGIRWNDGNKWTKKNIIQDTPAKKAVEWLFVAYIVFSLLAGVKEFLTRLNIIEKNQ